MFICEISFCGSVSGCRRNGEEISRRSKLFADLGDCTRSGDCEPAVRYVLETHNPEFRIVKLQPDGEYKNVIATHEDKARVCREIYSESETDFEADEDICNVYLIWQLAHEVVEYSKN